MKMTENTIFVAGGTSGIGRALAEAFHARGNRVVVAGRRQALLDEMKAANAGMEAILLDVRDPDGIARLGDELAGRFPDLNVVLNNAGFSRPDAWNGDVPEIEMARGIIDTNITGALNVAAAVLPILLRQPAATFITTTSGLAFVPVAGFSTYSASKAFLHSWLQSLRRQLRDTAVEVLELAPPYVQTELVWPGQASDPKAMPLAEYVADVLRQLEQADLPDGEILVREAAAYRSAERDGTYAEHFDALNAG